MGKGLSWGLKVRLSERTTVVWQRWKKVNLLYTYEANVLGQQQ